MIQKLIKKYTEILNTLEQNNSIKDSTDYYPYSIDIKNTNEFLNDLKDLANYTHSSLQFKKIEKPTFEEFKQEFFDYKGDEYFYKKTGEVWGLLQINDRYKNMYE